MSTLRKETPLNELTNIKVKENSMVDHPANRREFLIRKRDEAASRQSGECSGRINPILASDPELVALDKKDVATAATAATAATTEPPVEKDDSNCAACGSAFSGEGKTCKACTDKEASMKKDNASEAAVQFAALVETAIKSESAPPASPVAAVSAPGAAVTKTEPVIVSVPTARAVDGVSVAPVEEVTSKSDDVVSNTMQVTIVNTPEPIKLTPRLRAAAIAGMDEIVARVTEAKKRLDSTIADPNGCTYVPWEILCQLSQVDALADQLKNIGGEWWEAAATIAAGALSADAVEKAGAAMAAARLTKFTAAHGNMGSAFKEMQKHHKVMGDMLKELQKPVAKDDSVVAESAAATTPGAAAVVTKTETAATVAKTETVLVLTTPVVKNETVPVQVTVAEVIKTANDIEVLAKTVTELQRTVAVQSALLEKARLPQQSNAISVEGNGTGNGTINSEVAWPHDMGANSARRASRF